MLCVRDRIFVLYTMDRKEELAMNELPPKPEEPLESDCCGSGCSICVFDIYQRDLEAWEKECLQLRLSDDKAHCQEALCDAMSTTEFKEFELISIVSHTNDTAIYRFKLPALMKSQNLEAGQHLVLRSWLDGKCITRSYTPIDFEFGYFDVVIKIYSNGLMSSCISQWSVGDLIEWRGPFGDLDYQPNKYKHIVMLAAGTGIAPMLQVIKAIIENEDDETFIKLFYSCKKAADIVMKQRLDEYQQFWNFQTVYFLTRTEKQGIVEIFLSQRLTHKGVIVELQLYGTVSPLTFTRYDKLALLKTLREEDDAQYLKYGDNVLYQRIDEEYLSLNVSQMSTRILICGTKSFDKDMMNYCMKIGIQEKDVFKF